MLQTIAGLTQHKLRPDRARRTFTSHLQRQPALRGQPIQLYTAGGVVWLRGSVASDAAKEQAEQAASATHGVVAVRNRLDVRH